MVLSRGVVVEARDEKTVERDGRSGAGNERHGGEGAEWREVCAAEIGDRGRDCISGEQQFTGVRSAASESGWEREYSEYSGDEGCAAVDERGADGGARMVVRGGHA